MELAATMTADTRQQFGALLEQHRGIVFKVANTYCHHLDDRADLAQEIAAQLWRAWPGYDPSRSFTTWMYRVALNVAISQLRSERHRRTHAVPLDEGMHKVADGNAVDPETGQHVLALHRFIHAQQPLDRALLLLYLEDRGYREIADILGISESNVATKISRLKQRIRNEL